MLWVLSFLSLDSDIKCDCPSGGLSMDIVYLAMDKVDLHDHGLPGPGRAYPLSLEPGGQQRLAGSLSRTFDATLVPKTPPSVYRM